jgi:hypothetical protein
VDERFFTATFRGEETIAPVGIEEFTMPVIMMIPLSCSTDAAPNGRTSLI